MARQCHSYNQAPPVYYYPCETVRYTPPASEPTQGVFSVGRSIGLLRQGYTVLDDRGKYMFKWRHDGKIEISKEGRDGIFRHLDVGRLDESGQVVCHQRQAPKKTVTYEEQNEFYATGQSFNLLCRGYRTLNDSGNVMFEPTCDGRVAVLKRGRDGVFRSYGIGQLQTDGNVAIKIQVERVLTKALGEPIDDEAKRKAMNLVRRQALQSRFNDLAEFAGNRNTEEVLDHGKELGFNPRQTKAILDYLERKQEILREKDRSTARPLHYTMSYPNDPSKTSSYHRTLTLEKDDSLTETFEQRDKDGKILSKSATEYKFDENGAMVVTATSTENGKTELDYTLSIHPRK